MNMLLRKAEENSLYKTICVEYVLQKHFEDASPTVKYVLDEKAAFHFARAIEALDPLPTFIHFFNEFLSSSKVDQMTDDSPPTRTEVVLSRFANFLLEPVGQLEGSYGKQVYLIDAQKALHLLERSTFTWTTYHGSEQEYEAAQKAIATYIGTCAGSSQAQESPESIAASEALAQLGACESPANYPVAEVPTPFKDPDYEIVSYVRANKAALADIDRENTRKEVEDGDTDMKTVTPGPATTHDAQTPQAVHEATNTAGQSIKVKMDPDSSESGITSPKSSEHAVETVTNEVETVQAWQAQETSSSDELDSGITTPPHDDLEIDDDDEVFRQAGVLEPATNTVQAQTAENTTAKGMNVNVEDSTIANSPQRDLDRLVQPHSKELNLEQEAIDVAAHLEAAYWEKLPRYPEHYLARDTGAQAPPKSARASKKDRRGTFPRPHVQFAEWETVENLRAARAILNKFKVLALDTSEASLHSFCPYSLRGEKHAILSMSAQYTLNVGRDGEEELGGSHATGAQQINMRAALEKLFARYDGASLLAHQRNTPGAWSASRQDSETAEHGFLLVVLRLLRHRFMYLQERNIAQRKAGEHLASDFDALLPVVLPDRRPGQLFSSRAQKSGHIAPKQNSDNAASMLWRRSAALCRIIVACDHPCVILVLVRLATRLRIRLTTLLDELPIPQFCHWIATGTVSQSRLQAEKWTQTANKGGSAIRLDTSAASKAAATAQAEQLERDLVWAHEHILLPLLAVAAQRVPRTFFALDGRQECSVDACLHAIVPHPKQTQYSDFRAGVINDWQWNRGRVVLEGSTGGAGDDADLEDEEQPSFGSPLYNTSIPTQRRTFRAYDVADFEPVCEDSFDPPPAFLINRVLVWGSG